MNTRYTAALDLNELYANTATFTGLGVTSVELSKGDWESLGRPGQIQVVITAFTDMPF